MTVVIGTKYRDSIMIDESTLFEIKSSSPLYIITNTYRMETIYELKEKLRKAEEAEREKRRQEAMKREKEWRENNIIDVG